jgi:phospholipid/cholesterol/gamma-HCH transport system substrate-binding protein
MEKSRRKNILLGFFVLAGIVLFIVGLFLVGSKNELFTKTFVITTKFSNATGLKQGGIVRFNGVKVGIVKSVTLLNDSVVQVDMQIEETKRQYIPSNAIASIASDGLMGDKIINITTGRGQGLPIKDNEIIAAHNPMVMDQVYQTLNTTNENIRVISENLKALTSDLNSKNGTLQMLYKDSAMAGNLRQSFNNLNAVSNRVLGVSNTLQQIASEIKNGKGLAGELVNDTALGRSLVFTVDRLKETSNKLNDASKQFEVTSQRINSGKGTVNMLLSDTSFSANLSQSLYNIKSASAKLDLNMEALKHSFLTRGYFRKLEKKAKKQ